MLKRVVWLLFVVFANKAQAQVVALSGHVWDETNGEVVKGALVTDSLSALSTFTNSSAYYALAVGSGTHEITITADGYKTKKILLKVYRAVEKDFYLEPLGKYEIDSLDAFYHARFDYRSSHTSGRQSLIKNYQGVGSNQDLPKYLQNLPGVQMGVDGMAGLYVRGGNTDQNLQLMDGLPVYGLGRVFGFLSNYNQSMVRDFEFYRGVAPARYGGRSGGVLDVSYLEGSTKDFKGSFEFNPLCFNLTMDGYLDASRKTVMSLGARRSWLDLIVSSASPDQSLIANFHDLNLKITHRPNAKTQVSAWVYNGRDKYGINATNDYVDSFGSRTIDDFKVAYQYQNTLAGLSWSKMISATMQAKVTAGLSRYKYSNSISLEREVRDTNGLQKAKFELDEFNSITDYIVKSDFQKTLTNSSILRFGTEHVLHQFVPTIEKISSVNNSGTTRIEENGKVNNQNAIENTLYTELEFHSNTGATINLGGRLWSFIGQNKTFIRVEPRLLISQAVGEADGIKFSLGSSNQGMHQIGSVTGVLPENGWIGSSDKFRPMRNWQTTLGYYFPVSAGVEVNTDVYYKWFDGVSAQNGAQVENTQENFWESIIEQGTGTSYGAEIMLIKKYGRFSGVASYGYSNSSRKFETINFGKRFPFRWDRRHKLSAQAIYKHSERMTYNFSLVFMSGNPVSLPTGVYLDAFGNKVFDYQERNNYRLPNYFRIDVGFERAINPMRYSMDAVQQFWGIHIYNANARPNMYAGEVVTNTVNGQSVRTFNGRYSFVFLPSAFYKLKF